MLPTVSVNVPMKMNRAPAGIDVPASVKVARAVWQGDAQPGQGRQARAGQHPPPPIVAPVDGGIVTDTLCRRMKEAYHVPPDR